MSLLDEALSLSIRQRVGLGTLQVFTLVTRLGDAGLLIVLALGVAALLWRRGRGALALAWLLALGGNALLIPLLKRIFERVRPVHDHGLVSKMAGSRRCPGRRPARRARRRRRGQQGQAVGQLLALQITVRVAGTRAELAHHFGRGRRRDVLTAGQQAGEAGQGAKVFIGAGGSSMAPSLLCGRWQCILRPVRRQ